MFTDFVDMGQKADPTIKENHLLFRRQLTEFKAQTRGQLSRLFSTPQLDQVSKGPAEASGAPYSVV